MSTELVAGALLGASLQVAFDRLASRQVLNFFRQRKLHERLSKLKEKLSATYAVVEDAEQKLLSDSQVKAWLDAVKDAMFDADDPLNEIDYEFSKCELEAESQTHSSKALESHEPLSAWELVEKTKKQNFGEWINNALEIVEKYDHEGEEELLSHAVSLKVTKGEKKKEKVYDGLGQCSNEFIGSSSGQHMKDKERLMEAKVSELMHTTQKQGEMLKNLLQYLHVQPFCVPPLSPIPDAGKSFLKINGVDECTNGK